eukprot:CAMPEP_0115871962 /NCGR_PEP_ID=MMETSP0287-20121206/23164_1 /TAXON_ID=412157 /ORGANISM="Chrysochromulina rotalis, Strain UIO044" /LENGTH=47 /DNA_ID= /DNA_START= /DNA_END= /DNA_ORIENTATION=
MPQPLAIAAPSSVFTSASYAARIALFARWRLTHRLASRWTVDTALPS